MMPRKVAKLAKPLALIDLFAGCGGMSLGFEMAGFAPVLVSELSDAARATYLANHAGTMCGRKVVSIGDGKPMPDFDLEANLLAVGDVAGLSPKLLQAVRANARHRFGEIDVVTGGPPCQGYSGIGHRRTHRVEKLEIPSNHLYGQMIRVIKDLQPKAFVFENVRGLLWSRWTSKGIRGEIWADVQDAFKNTLGRHYAIAHNVVNASWYGVPQNRPRVILIGIRRDFSHKVDVKATDAIEGNFLPPKSGPSYAPDIIDVLGDLVDDEWSRDNPLQATLVYPKQAMTPAQKELRTSRDGLVVGRKGDDIREHVYSRHSERVLDRFEAILKSDTAALARLKTKKFAQRALPSRWGNKAPSITVTSLPDDYVHFSQPRILTVREWARLQGFPDWYEFHGPRTTGGERRAGNPSKGDWSREVPRYTQIGNAVPVRLAHAVASHLRAIIG